MFAITAGFHRYFSHRTYRLARVPQFLLAFLGQTAAQKGVLWWAANHRHHHKYSDRPEDIHSPLQKGFWWSHMGWILARDHAETDPSRIPDLAKYPELVWLDRNQYVPTLLYGVALYFAFGWTGLFYGYFLSTVLLWHGTFSINSVMHVFGRRVYRDDRRLAQQLPLRARHDGRGLAQQPPLGARLRGAGLPLVAGGRELLPALARREARPRARPAPPAASAGARPRARPIGPGAPSRPPASTSACRA